MAKVFGSFSRLVSLLFRKDGQDVTLRPNQSTTYTAARDVQLPPGDEAHVIVSASSVATLTNKTFDADGTGNSITNIEDADIKAGANIALSKLATGALPTGITVASANIVDGTIVNDDINASAAIARSKLDFGSGLVNADIATGANIDAAKLGTGSVSNTEFGYLDGVTSAIQTQLDGKQPLDSDLTAVAGLSTTGLIARTGTGTAATRTVTGTANRITVTDGDGVSGNPTLDVGSNVVVAGGNTIGATLTIGTNDNQNVDIEALNSTVIRVRPSGNNTRDVEIIGTKGLQIPAGDTAARPSGPAVAGTIRLNTDTNEFEGFANSAWQAIGGGVNEQPLKNYLKTYATAAVAPGTLSTVAANGNIATTAGLFYADATSGSAALTQSSSTALRGSFNYLSALSGADTAGGRFFQFPAFALDAADLGKPVSLSFDLTGLTAAGWDVVVARYNSSGTFQELIPVAGTASSSTSTPSAQLLTGTVQQRGFFVAGSTAGDLYAVRFRRLSGSEQVRLDTLYVGPQTQLAGAPVTDWQSYTPTVGLTGGTVTGQWRRVGDSLEGRVSVTWAGAAGGSFLSVSLPSGLTIDTTKLPNSGTNAALGVVSGLDAGVAAAGGFVRYLDTTSVILVGKSPTTYQYDPVTPTFPFTIAASDAWLAEFRVPIANWSSNVTMAERAVEEYASNSNATSTASDLTSFANGPAGNLVPQPSIGTAATRRVRFQTAIQATDSIVVELRTSSGSWIPAATFGAPYVRQSSSEYGISAAAVNTTDVDVVFNAQGVIPSNATYAGNGSAWSVYSTNLWRVRKVSGGAAVGYPVGVQNLWNAVPTVMSFDAFNPTDVTGTTTNATSRTIQDAGSGNITVSSISSGTVTFTFNESGKYKVDVSSRHSHANTYTNSVLQCLFGGTATRVGVGTLEAAQEPTNDRDGNGATNLFITASAGQTLTVQTQFTLVGAGVAANHTAQALVIVQRVS